MSEEQLEWHVVGAVDDIDEEDVMRFDHGGETYAIYHIDQGFFPSAGMCTHEAAHMADGFVIGDIIECPMHQGRFHIPTGKAKVMITSPVTALRTLTSAAVTRATSACPSKS